MLCPPLGFILSAVGLARHASPKKALAGLFLSGLAIATFLFAARC